MTTERGPDSASQSPDALIRRAGRCWVWAFSSLDAAFGGAKEVAQLVRLIGLFVGLVVFQSWGSGFGGLGTIAQRKDSER